MLLDYIIFSLEALLPVAVAVIFYVLKKHTNYHKINTNVRQLIYGIIYGAIAILGTHFGPKLSGAAVNARDASVVIAGLVFGAPAGLIAGFIGGVERLIVGLLIPETFGFTVIACSLSTFLAGVVSAILRIFMFDDKRPGYVSGFFVGFVIEAFHLFMVFVTNANEYKKAFDVVLSCTPPMLIANSISVMLALLFVGIVDEGHKNLKKPDTHKLHNRFVITLSTLTSIAFVLSSLFVFFFQNRMATKTTNSDLKIALTETTNEVSHKTIEQAYEVKNALEKNPVLTPADLQYLCDNFGIVEINLINKDNHIIYSNIADYIPNSENPLGYDMMYVGPDGNDQPKIFVEAFRVQNLTEFAQDFRDMAAFSDTLRKYSGVLIEDVGSIVDDGILQIGYDKNGIDDLITNFTQYKTVGNKGSILVLNDKNEIISSGNNSGIKSNKTNAPQDLINAIKSNEQFATFSVEINGVNYYAQYSIEDSHTIISLLPVEEAELIRNISIFVNSFLEIIVFGLLFATIYLLVKKLVIERIEGTNNGLKQITEGKLNIKINGGDVTEFKQLANGINSTVDALKGYIDAANKRIDEELALAKTIQSAVLPSTFPAFPDRKEFDVHASMHAAKEVGGDFYDFYFSNSKTFHITIADVSGKGIPAALFMMRAKSILKSLSQTNMQINEAFMKGNDSLCDGNEAGMFVTAWSASINLDDGTLSFANGGHNPPLIKRTNGKFEYLKAPVNLVLAAMNGMPYGLNKVKLEPGDIIYLYTDGVTEGVNTKTEQFGEERLKNTLNAKEFASCKEICDYVYSECVKFADGAAQFDDITMLAFKYNGK